MWQKFFEETKMDIKWQQFLKGVDKNELDKYPKELGDLNDLVRAAYILKDASIKSIDQYFSNSKLDAYYL